MSTGLIATAIAVPFATVVVEVLFNELFAVVPSSLVQVGTWLVMAVVYLFIFGALMNFLFGRQAWEQAKGNLLADAIKGLLRIAFTWPLLIVWGVVAVYLWLR